MPSRQSTARGRGAGDDLWIPGPQDVVRVQASKRALDVVLSALLLLASVPFGLLVLLGMLVDALVRAEDRGPVTYTETRVSQGRPFRLHKFRILKVRAIEEEIVGRGDIPKTVENRAENLTAMGRFLKKTGLDEVPQFYNILRGDMSLVGPRPKPVPEYETGVAEGDWRRTVARAGLTGPAQLLKGSVRTPDDDRLADLEYLRRMRGAGQLEALAIDLGILWRTIGLMLKMTGE